MTDLESCNKDKKHINKLNKEIGTYRNLRSKIKY